MIIMKNLIHVFIFSLLITFITTNAQEVAPLQLGNIWIYDTGTTLVKVTVVDTNSVIDTIRYSKFVNISNYGFISDGYSRLRVDDFYTSRRDTSYPAPNHEKIYWKKNALLGDTWENYAPDFPLVYTVVDTYTGNVFGIPTVIKHLQIDGSLVLFNEYWTEEFGKMSRSDFGGLLESLQGCVIDGIVYGDTSFTIVSVENEFQSDESFVLNQNYPNPFNPITTIKYDIIKAQDVTVTVYDILGREIEVLVNEQQQPGSYEVKWDASNVSSGIYFYRLNTTDYVDTKKMILLK